MWIKECNEALQEQDAREQDLIKWIVSDLKLNLTILHSKIHNDIQPEYNRWYEHAIKYIEESWID